MPLSATDVLNAEFLGIRARLIDVAAALEHIGRAKGSVTADPRMVQIRHGLELLCGDGPDQTERLQAIFSLPYDEHWKERIKDEG